MLFVFSFPSSFPCVNFNNIVQQQQSQQIQSSQSQLAIVSIQQAVMPTTSTVVSQPVIIFALKC